MTLAAAVLLGGAASASAAAEFGSGCTSTETFTANFTLVQTARQGTVAGAPAAGVVTKWTVSSGEGISLQQKLKIERPAGGNQFTAVGESAAVIVAPGSNSFTARIPIAIGDLIGLATPDPLGGVLFCEKQGAGDRIAWLEQRDQAVGTTGTFTPVNLPWALPARVTIEPDADNDGYGDESQDSCPTEPSIHQGACPSPSTPAPSTPPPSVSTPPLPAKPHPLGLASAHRGSATVKVTCDLAGTVTVTGRVAVGGGASTTLRGGTKTLAAGERASFTLKFTPALKEALAELPAKRKLKLKVTVAAVAGGVAGAQKLTVNLPGQG